MSEYSEVYVECISEEAAARIGRSLRPFGVIYAVDLFCDYLEGRRAVQVTVERDMGFEDDIISCLESMEESAVVIATSWVACTHLGKTARVSALKGAPVVHASSDGVLFDVYGSPASFYEMVATMLAYSRS